MDINELIGSFELSGLDITRGEIEDDHGYVQECEICRIILNGITYEFSEDPDDGYRSYHRGPKVVGTEVKNTFAPVGVVCTHKIKGVNSGTDDMLVIYSLSGLEVLLVGTENIDDYYPYWCCHFSAANLSA